MPISIGQNISSLMAQRNLTRATTSYSQSMQKLSSGMRINRPSDDSAGAAVVASLNTRAAVYTQAVRNANDAISATSIATGATEQLSSIVFRLKELAAGAANGSLGRTQRLSLDTEAYSLTNEYNRIISVTQFNGRGLIDGSYSSFDAQLGFGMDERIGFAIGSKLSRNLGTGASTRTLEDMASYIGPTGGIAGDFDSDGKLDFIVVELTTGLQISFGDGAGGVATRVSLSTTPSIPSDVAAADFNGDGRVDIAIGGGTSAFVFINNGNRTFSAASGSPIALGASANSIEATDMTGDGIVDLVVGTTSGVSFLRGNGDGTFASPSSIALSTINQLVTGDFNGDGRPDIAARTTSGTVYTLNGSGNGSFSLASTLATGIGNGALRVGDLNHDGLDDLVISGSSGGNQGANLLISQGNGNYNSITNLGNAQGGSSGAIVQIGDLNGDGHLDIVQGNVSGTGNVYTFYGNGDGTFQSVNNHSIGSGYSAQALILGDFNGDSVLDLVVGDSGIEAVQIRTQNTTSSNTVARLDLTTAAAARNSLSILETMLMRISNELGNLGAGESRISSALRTLTSRRENYLAASGRISNVDVAEESAVMIRNRILQETATAILAQANQTPQIALSLLK